MSDGTGNAAPAASAGHGSLLAAAGQNRPIVNGCPHCGSQKLHRWGHVSGAAPLPLRRVPAQLQRADGNPLGPLAKEASNGPPKRKL